METYDVLIIGAGPSGSVAAAYLKKNNFNVLVLEKEIFPRFVIGESLLPHCMDQLDEVDLLDAVKLGGFQKKTGATFYRDNTKCEFSFSEQYTSGWKWTWQVKRANFDEILVNEIQKKGVDVRFQSTVKKVSCNSDIQEIEYENEEGDLISVKSKFIIDASGYGRVLPNIFDLNLPSDLVARGSIFTHVIDENRTDKASNNIFIHSFNNNKAWLWAIPFSDGHTSVGIVSDDESINEFSLNKSEKFKAFIQSFDGLKGRFEKSKLLFEPKTILGYSISVKQLFGEGYVLCGNSTEFLDPVFSSGVTLATYSGLKAAKLVHQQILGDKVDWQKDYEDVMLKGVDVFRSYVNAWYNGDLQTIFFAESIEPQFKKQICSVLAGYVWDETNPFIKKHKTILPTLAKVIKIKESV